MTDYTIVIPAWNESDLISFTIKSARLAMAEQQYTGQIVVVDNNSTDHTADIAKQQGVQVVFEPVNQISRARNTGAASTNTPWLVFLDADTTLNGSLLRASLESLACGKSIGGGSLVAFDRELKGIPRAVFNFWNWWSKTSRTAAGCYVYCTRSAFDEAGGFDQTKFAAEEIFFSKQNESSGQQNHSRIYHSHFLAHHKLRSQTGLVFIQTDGLANIASFHTWIDIIKI